MKYTLANIHKVSSQLHRHSVEAEIALYEARLVDLRAELAELDTPECIVRWLGVVWYCFTHSRYIEDSDVCPDSEPRDRARA